uniref:NADH dehydrogenase subunit 6 n=1 Tax=Ghauriana sinensis TaxID=2729071 RepID=A0A6M3R5U5_9HEMI|nr:NADH dehydrogenase subunit 6 [Ghauriana sinensis]
MKYLIIKLMFFVSIMIQFFNNPMCMGLFLFIQTFLAILYINMIMLNSWFMMISFLMLIGGLLILIMYMNGIASNKMFTLNINFSLILMIMLILMMLNDDFINSYMMKENDNLMNEEKLNLSFMKIYNFKSMFITIMLVIYLLLTMISVSKCVKINEGPLRMFFYE